MFQVEADYRGSHRVPEFSSSRGAGNGAMSHYWSEHNVFRCYFINVFFFFLKKRHLFWAVRTTENLKALWVFILICILQYLDSTGRRALLLLQLLFSSCSFSFPPLTHSNRLYHCTTANPVSKVWLMLHFVSSDVLNRAMT